MRAILCERLRSLAHPSSIDSAYLRAYKPFEPFAQSRFPVSRCHEMHQLQQTRVPLGRSFIVHPDVMVMRGSTRPEQRSLAR